MTSSEVCADDGCTKLAMSTVIDLCRRHHDLRHDEMLPRGLKVCTTCGETKALDDFSAAAERPSGVRSKCRACESKYQRAWRERNPGYGTEYMRKMRPIKGYARRARFGLTPEDIELMLAAQDGKCAICFGVLDVPNVDHCHESGRVRALLCRECNLGLGQFKDQPELLIRAADYLREHSAA